MSMISYLARVKRGWLAFGRRNLSARVSWGGLRRLTPMSRVFGFDRGQPIDRYYMHQFLRQQQAHIRGSVMEIAEPEYTRQFGGDRVTQSHVLHAVSGNPQATIVGDLCSGEGIPDAAFDCIILTQTLHVIYDMPAAIATCYAALKPGGALLCTFPGISQISRHDHDRWGDFWRLTDCSAQRLLGDCFGEHQVSVSTFGNVLSSCALLHGMAVEELSRHELDHCDPDYQVLVTVRAVKQ